MQAELFDGHMVEVDERTADVGGSFFYEPLRAYGPLPLRWAYEQLAQQQSPVLFDVGANTGCYTLLAALLPELTVYAFEPVPMLYDILKANVQMNGLAPRVRLIKEALADYFGWGLMREVVPHGGVGCSMLGGKPMQGKMTEDYNVPVTTLDRFCETNQVFPTFLKIDVEGGERFVLQGAVTTITTHHPTLLVEYEPLCTAQYGYRPQLLAHMLRKWGYRHSSPEGLDLMGEYPA